MLKVLHKIYIQWPDANHLREFEAAFEAIRGLPYVVGAVDGSHIPIICPPRNGADYYNRKKFHSVLLQAVVSPNCLIWDYDCGWCGSLHDWRLFKKSDLGRACAAKELGDYCLVGDAAYQPRWYMLTPYKGLKNLGITHEQYLWNFLQSSTRMPVERAFGILKARWRILLKRNDMKLSNTMRVISTCIVLHNMCIVHKDSFDETWLKDAKSQLVARMTRHQQGGRQYTAAEDALQEMECVLNPQVRAGGTTVEGSDVNDFIDEDTLYEEGCRRRLAIQATLVRAKGPYNQTSTSTTSDTSSSVSSTDNDED